MFLKSVELYGFKSFADRTRFEFSDGITSLLGPNGSGKSNVVDSVKWVLGTQALSSIRASKREDVIFNGTDKRKPMPMCEVILTLNNEEKILNIDATEVEIKRRAFRNGENEYYINREKALLRNIKELFMDTGVGKAAYSIMEQGKIDQILFMKPEERRYIFEEASGISRFKQQSEEAGRKLQRTDENLAQVDIHLKEAEKLYNSRKIQVEKVLRHRELSKERERLEVELQLSYLQSLGKLKDFRKDELAKREQELASIDSVLDSSRDSLDKEQEELERLRTEREEMNGRIRTLEEKINSYATSIGIYDERYQEISQRSRLAKERAQQVQDRMDRDRQKLDERLAELEDLNANIALTEEGIKKTSEEVEKLKADKIVHGLDIEKLEQEITDLGARRVEITASISDLANDIANNLEKDLRGSGYSSAARAKAEKNLLEEISRTRKIVDERVAFLREISSISFDPEVFRQAIDDADEAFMTQIDEIKGLFQEYSGTIPTFLDDFTAPEGTLARKTQLDKELEDSYTAETDKRTKIGDLAVENERLSRLIILKESDQTDLEKDKIQFETRRDSLQATVRETKASLQQMEFDFSDASHSVKAEEEKVNEILEKIDSLKNERKDTADQVASLRNSLSELNLSIDEKGREISEKNSGFRDMFNRRQELTVQIATDRENLRSLDENIAKVYTDFFDNTGKSLREFDDHEITTAVEDLKSSLDSVKKKIQDLGYINNMAEDEYNEAKKNYDFYSKNMADLTKAKNDLAEVIAEIRSRSEAMFLETYNQISESFQEMFTTLFGGGKAELVLLDEENILESGIDIRAQPPGKRMLPLNLLSGGEKSLTAVALLFATYMVKPSPFCILDEIDAALDARNIGAFLRVLEKFEDKSQFIIITHNKGTVLGSDCLLGVTQEEAGVSKMIGYKLEDIEDIAKQHDTLKG